MSDRSARTRAQMNFNYWISKKASKAEQEAWNNAGMDNEGKAVLLTKWLLFKARNFQVETTVTTSQSTTLTTQNSKDKKWMAKEQMDKEHSPLELCTCQQSC